MVFTTGTKLGAYEIVGLLGTGGMGEKLLKPPTKKASSTAI
jgi:hypothetical protein